MEADLPIKITPSLNMDLSEYEVVPFEIDPAEAKAQANLIIPLAANMANAAEQWNQAIVRFPKGCGWNDLINRKTPEWKGYKQLGILKKGKFQPQAAIKKAKLQPAAIANLALQGAALVVGQAYMTEINHQLEGIQSGISAIQKDMHREREAKLEARFQKLCEYLLLYDENSTNPEKRQAVLNSLEAIDIDALEAWNFQIKTLCDLSEIVAAKEHMTVDEVESYLQSFKCAERDAQTAFRLYAAVGQVRMQYDGDFDTARIEREREKISGCFGEYERVRTHFQSILRQRVKTMRGDLFAFPSIEDDGYKPQNLPLDAVHVVVQGAGALARNPDKYTPLALLGEGRSQVARKKRYLIAQAVQEDPIADATSENNRALDRMDFIYNKADTMLIDSEGVRFLRKK